MNKEKKCKYCSIYNKDDSTCGVNIYKEGESYEMVVSPDDLCIWDELDIEVQQIRIWKDENNKYIEYPDK